MKAVVISGVRQVQVEDVPDPTPGPLDVVVEVAGCGLCGTDLHILDGEFAPSLPIIPGHEFAGTVVARGTEVTTRRTGERVAVDPSLYCFRCEYCRRGRNNLCERWGAIGVNTAGAAAEFVSVPAANCIPVPTDVRLADAALIEPLACAVRGVDVLRSRVGAHVLIYGAGTMGLMMLQLAKRVGATSVDIVDVNPAKLAYARRLGVSGAVAAAAELNRPRGWDVVIDATGRPEAIADGLERVGAGGVFLQFGVADPAARVSISPFRIYNKEITIAGSMAVLHSFERAAELFSAGILDPNLFITDRFPLVEFPAALDHFAGGHGLKTQLTPAAG